MVLNEQNNGTDITKCPDCGADMVKTNSNDPLVLEKTEYKCTDCGNEHTVYHE